MAHVVIGYPSLEETVSIVKTMVESGVSIVELQIPFSDPLADGSTIMKACEESLAHGTKVKDAFTVMKRLSSQVSIPLLLWHTTILFLSTVLRSFVVMQKTAGASGLIVPDMPLDEEDEEHFFALCKKYIFILFQVLSPASTGNRLKKNAKVANGLCIVLQGKGQLALRISWIRC